MKNFIIFTKAQTVIAVEDTGENLEQIANLMDNRYKRKSVVTASSEDEAKQMFIGSNKPKRGIISQINKGVYIAFHAIMAFWWFKYTTMAGAMINDNAGQAYESAANAGVVIGGAIGTSMIFVIWGLFGMFGAFVLYFTKAKPWIK
ncbi:hypothetical protein [Vibrio sp. WXL210]|uniref:hypothetical protein n=1 Tax=Vibrio sp. WXL210 TaxID=3450709 RepID=UPI003EC8CB44